ncbi:5-methyltetrahydropteroyltriglutamate--homocysteine S-methyltransferase [Anaerococcus sp. WCA-380-WT-2B]|uniref:5-methyltetrahydropteroyltriglutamate--homocysteine S-methyltransferase n=1 Tax=Anaerococcus porci TaxID=2652269 RepID=A0A6N7VEK0_9FIRM|nr:5-methyltetrahydropteroyltriglutamate--homocysteine S-methyltransferase [Anaerococcus porci]MSS77878.1 5-methyltetrahydropteroyltriglutamate--homocysteine S-methyltransferase [Anaerococcus porci]
MTIKAPYKFDIVGSFLRPESLKKARKDYDSGFITDVELRKIEDEEIEKLVKKEKEAGLKFITDGEFRRSWWHYDFFWGLNGVEKYQLDEKDRIKFHGETLRPDSVRIVGKITAKGHPFLEHFKFLQQFEEEEVKAKQTIPAPAQFLRTVYTQIKEGAIYENEEDFIKDVSNAYGEFFQQIYDLGCRTVQIDDCTWGALVDDDAIKEYEKAGKDVEKLKEIYLKINNESIDKAPIGLNVLTHICRGNYKSTFHFKGGYDKIADYLLAGEHVNGFFLEYDDKRSGSFEALKKVPEGKSVVLGLVTSKLANLEKKEDIIDRIKEASKYLDKSQIAISPQCGFSSTEEGNKLKEEDQWKKIALLREIAEEIL